MSEYLSRNVDAKKSSATETFKQKIEYLLPLVQNPTQYLGNEYNSVHKDWHDVSLRTLFLFPDSYEIGMSHLGLRVLYHVVNLQPDFLMERSFMPLDDMQKLMREHNLPLFSWESCRPAADFDVLAFTLQYEMSYSNVLSMLRMAGIEEESAKRSEADPLIIAGGPCTANSEPLAPFIDLFVLGEGEEVILEILKLYRDMRGQGADRAAFLKRAAIIDGVYVPSLYEPIYDDKCRYAGLQAAKGAPAVIKKRVVRDFAAVPFPQRDIVPFIRVVHDRLMLEIMRGCSRGCRFCQAGASCRPVREKPVDVLLTQARVGLKATGYDEIGLVSLSTADYSAIDKLIDGLLAEHAPNGVGVSLPSLRADAFSIELAAKVQQVRKSGLTFAPEAGSQRLRNIINKGITDEDIFNAAGAAFKAGWDTIKLYFMIGLPQETYEDLDGIVEMASRLKSLYKETTAGRRRRPLALSVSVAFFVPKPDTPFQWLGQEGYDSLAAKAAYLQQRFRNIRQVKFSYHDLDLSFLEAAFARGDRRLSQVLRHAVSLGCQFDGWHEHFNFALWRQAFADCGLSIEQFANHTFERDDALPWAHLDYGLNNGWLWQEWQKALSGEITLDCRGGKCHGCGVCGSMSCENKFVAGGEKA